MSLAHLKSSSALNDPASMAGPNVQSVPRLVPDIHCGMYPYALYGTVARPTFWDTTVRGRDAVAAVRDYEARVGVDLCLMTDAFMRIEAEHARFWREGVLNAGPLSVQK